MGCGGSIHKPRPWELRIEIEWRATEGGRVYTPEFSGKSSAFSIDLNVSSRQDLKPPKPREIVAPPAPRISSPPIYPKQWLPKKSSPHSTPQMPSGPISSITGTLVFIVPQEKLKASFVFRFGRGLSLLRLPTAGIPAGSEEFVSECNGTYCAVKRVELVNPNLEGKEKVVEERVEVPVRVPTSTQAPAQQTPYGPPADTNDSLFRV